MNVNAGPLGQRFALYHAPDVTAARGLVVHIHPFAEEMNRSRRMAALQSRALAQAGFAVLQMDLLGCGDSAGDFGDATWEIWIDDIRAGVNWLSAKHSQVPVWLWGHRAGALLACAAAAYLDSSPNFLFWQPAQQGKSLLQQFLRLKAAAQLANGGGKQILEAARDDLSAGRSVQVAGYMLSPALAKGLEGAVLAPSPPSTNGTRRMAWLEVSGQVHAVMSPASQTALLRWQATGYEVATRAVRGPQFWQTTEVEDAPALLAATLSAIGGDSNADTNAPAARTIGST